MKIVLDTNVLISGLINPTGVPAKILNLILNQNIIVLYDTRIIKEYVDVLKRRKFSFTKESIDPLLDFIKYEGCFVAAEPLKISFKDEDDKMFLEVAKTGRAEYLITGNIIHFPKERFIVTPREFIEKW
ncbi:MAG: putative toxin-antitoxin system toxin component, PIN family [Desulfuromusa sp.]